MSSRKRRPDGRRRAWGRGPIILPFESLEGRQLLATTSAAVSNPLPDLVATAFDTTSHAIDWGGSTDSSGFIYNQGDGPTTEPVTVTIFASATNVIGPTSLPLASVVVPAGLAPGATFSFTQSLSLPLASIDGVGPTSQNAVWIGLRVDAAQVQPESDRLNNEGRGIGKDTSIITISPPLPANLVGSSIAITPSSTTWGSTIIVTAQVRNNAQGAAPATRARIVLTPSGSTPGGVADVTIGSVDVPPIPAWQTANVTQQLTLPDGPASTLAAANNFVLSMVEDADYITNPMNNHAMASGLGIDQSVVTIAANPAGYVAPLKLPDVAPSAIAISQVNLVWGGSFLASATLQNLGQADASNFRVRFLLTGTSGALDQAVVLGDTIIPGLKAGGSTTVNPTLTLPRRLPYGSNVSGLAYGRIVVMIDPEQSLDQTVRTNDSAASAPVLLRVLGTDGTSQVPTGPAISYTPTNTAANPAPKPTTVKMTAKEIRAAKIQKAIERTAARKLIQKKPHYQKVQVVAKKENPIVHQFNSYTKKITKAFTDLTHL